jgi:hypothetical protein
LRVVCTSVVSATVPEPARQDHRRSIASARTLHPGAQRSRVRLDDDQVADPRVAPDDSSSTALAQRSDNFDAVMPVCHVMT